jgi:hypothetical protein
MKRCKFRREEGLSDVGAARTPVDIPLVAGGECLNATILMESDDPLYVFETATEMSLDFQAAVAVEWARVARDGATPLEKVRSRKTRTRPRSGPAIRFHLLVPREYYDKPWWTDAQWWARVDEVSV